MSVRLSVCPFSPGLTIGRGGIFRVPIDRAHRAELANHTAGRGQCVFWELWVVEVGVVLGGLGDGFLGFFSLNIESLYDVGSYYCS